MPVILYKRVFLGILGLGQYLGITIDEMDALELCKINSEIVVATVWIVERLDGTKEEIVVVDSVWIVFIHWHADIDSIPAFLKSGK